MGQIFSMLMVIVFMVALLVIINFVVKLYVKNILTKLKINGEQINIVFSVINLTIICTGIICAVISFTNYNPNVDKNTSVKMIAPLPVGFKIPTKAELYKSNNQLTKGELKRIKQKELVEATQIKLVKQALEKKGK